MENFLHILIHSLLDSLSVLPFLLLVYIVIELIEHKAQDKLKSALSNSKFGVIGASALGLIPQCGFSVAAANLYSEGLITAGTLAAVFISTSDEAIPIIASTPGSVKWLLPLISIKFVYAIIAGFIVNAVFRMTKLDKAVETHHTHSKSVHVHEAGEHHHCSHCDSVAGIIKNAVIRTLSIFAFIFITTAVLDLLIKYIGESRIADFMASVGILEPLAAALVGLIPNCAASVVLSELFVNGAIGFGSLAAGLCAGAGVGLLVLFRVNKSSRQNFAMFGMLYGLSALLGVVIELVI